jgi:hypothetical protein
MAFAADSGSEGLEGLTGRCALMARAEKRLERKRGQHSLRSQVATDTDSSRSVDGLRDSPTIRRSIICKSNSTSRRRKTVRFADEEDQLRSSDGDGSVDLHPIGDSQVLSYMRDELGSQGLVSRPMDMPPLRSRKGKSSDSLRSML